MLAEFPVKFLYVIISGGLLPPVFYLFAWLARQYHTITAFSCYVLKKCRIFYSIYRCNLDFEIKRSVCIS